MTVGGRWLVLRSALRLQGVDLKRRERLLVSSKPRRDGAGLASWLVQAKALGVPGNLGSVPISNLCFMVGSGEFSSKGLAYWARPTPIWVREDDRVTQVVGGLHRPDIWTLGTQQVTGRGLRSRADSFLLGSIPRRRQFLPEAIWTASSA